MQLQQSKNWDMEEFELVNTWHYCKADLIMGMPMNLCEYDGKKRIHSKAKGFRFELYDVKMNPIIIECWFDNAVGKGKASGAKAMLKIYMRKDRNESEVLGENDKTKCPHCGSEKHFVTNCPNMRKDRND